MRALAVTVTGSGHERRGQPGQDAAAQVVLGDRILVAAVADGAGSAPLGGEGSAIAVATAIDTCRRMIEGGLEPDRPRVWSASARAVVADVQAALAAEATKRQVKTTDLATTLLVAVARPDRVAVAQIGDGAIVAAVALAAPVIGAAPVVAAPAAVSMPYPGPGIAGGASNAPPPAATAAPSGSTANTGASPPGAPAGPNAPSMQYVALTSPAHGEHLNETVFVTSPGAIESLQTQVWPYVATHLAMFSDGLQMLALNMPQALPHGPFFAPLFTFLDQTADLDEVTCEVRKLLLSPQVRDRTDDDLSLILASWADPRP